MDANTIKFYLDDQYQFMLHPKANYSAMPFHRPMHVNMVCETYDWMASPKSADPTNTAINTTYYDWVRADVPTKQTAAGKGPKVRIPRIASDYVNVYKP